MGRLQAEVESPAKRSVVGSSRCDRHYTLQHWACPLCRQLVAQCEREAFQHRFWLLDEESEGCFKMKKHNEHETAVVDRPYITKLKDWLHPLLRTLAKSKIKYNIEVLNDCNTIAGKPIIFVGNHSTSSDFPIVTKVTGRRSYVLVGNNSCH